MIKLYLFDLDDTIVNHSEAMNAALFKLTSLLPNKPDFKDVWATHTKKYWKLFEEGLITFDEQRKKRIKSVWSHFGIALTENELSKIDLSYMTHYEKSLKTNKLAAIFIKELSKNNQKIGILSNGNGPQQRRKLKKTKLLPYINSDYIFISEEIGHSKPHTAIYDYIENKTNSSGGEIFFVSDSWDIDLEPALKKGWEVMLWKGGDSLYL